MTSVLAIDFGFGDVKAIYDGRLIKFPNIIGSPDRIRWTGELSGVDNPNPLYVRKDGKTNAYFVGEMAQTQSSARWSTIYRRRHPEDLQALLCEVLYRFSIEGVVPILVSGLPPGWIADDRSGHLATLGGEITYYRGEGGRPRSVTFQDVRILPQPLGTYMAMAFFPSGDYRDQSLVGTPEQLQKPLVAVIDIGHHTTDGIVTSGGKVSDTYSWTVPNGISDLHAALVRNTSTIYGFDLPDPQAALRDGKMWVDGEWKDLPVEDERRTLAKAILSKIRSKVGDGQTLHRIIITGGGAHVMADLITEAYPRAEVVDGDPTTGNVRGYEVYGKAILAKKG